MTILDNFKTIDITDKSTLEEQFNYSREKYFQCLETMESISKKISELKEENLEFTTSVYSEGISAQAAGIKLRSDEDYQRRLIEIEGYEAGLKILEEKVNFIKSDIRILQNSMYNKF